MNKLLLLALLGCALALVIASEEEEQSLQSLEGGLVRDVREADPGRKNGKRGNNKRKRNKRKNKVNKRKNNKRKNNKRKTKNNISKRKNNKRKNNKRKNNKRKNNKRKNNKRKNNKRKNNKRKKGGDREEECLSMSCVDNASSMMKVQTKIANYENQLKRINQRMKIAGKKSDKSGVFSGALMRLTAQAGGNSSAPMCGTSADNAGALQMKNLTETLMACEADVMAACSTSASLTAPNATEVSACEASMGAFKTYTDECKEMSGAEGCTCWEGNDDITAALEAIKMCDLKDKNKEIVAAVADCKAAFGKCRKYEDAVASVISSCNQDPDQLKTKLANLQANSNAVGDVQTKIASVLARKSSTKAITSGAIFIEQCGFLIILIGQDPSNFGILAMAVEITAFDGTFTAADKEALSAVSEDMDAAADALAEESASVMAMYTELTGEELSEDDISAIEGGEIVDATTVATADDSGTTDASGSGTTDASGSGTTDASDSGTTDASGSGTTGSGSGDTDATDATDATEATEATDATDATDATEATDATDTTDGEITETTGATDGTTMVEDGSTGSTTMM